MNDLLDDFYAYHDEANYAYIRALTQAKEVPEKAHALFSHVLDAHAIWLDRLQGRRPAFGVWQVQPPGRYAAIHIANMQESRTLLAEGDLARSVAYTNSRGQTFRNTAAEILLHVVNHSTYHRGQIASWLRRAGLEPPVTDYIFLRRAGDR